MIAAKTYVHEDKHGAWRIGESDISLDSVVIGFQEGHSAEAIQQQYPALTLEEVYGAIAFYLANRDEVHSYLQRQEQVWEELRRRIDQSPSPVVERLRAIRKVSTRDES